MNCHFSNRMQLRRSQSVNWASTPTKKRSSSICRNTHKQGTGPQRRNMATSNNFNSDVNAISELDEAAKKFGWDVDSSRKIAQATANNKQIMEIPVAAIRRPLQRVRSNNREKVEVLKKSIQEIGLLEPIDVLEVDGQYWGFSGCHRYQAHEELGKETITCRVVKATPQILRYHMM